MRIAVCMKQVPAYSEGNMDEKTGLIIRNGLESIVNIYDLAALEAALQIKEKNAADIDVFTMGPKSAEQVLREAFALGADKGYLICDRGFGGADVLATSYTLMQALKSKGPYDLIICGKQTTDGDTAQVSGALAKWFEIPHFTGICRLLELGTEMIEAEQNLDGGIIRWQIGFPCLLAVDREEFIPRMPSLKLRMKSRKKEIVKISMQELADKEAAHYGLQGSATRVKKIFPPKRTKRQSLIRLEGAQAAEHILQTFNEIKGIKGNAYADK